MVTSPESKAPQVRREMYGQRASIRKLRESQKKTAVCFNGNDLDFCFRTGITSAVLFKADPEPLCPRILAETSLHLTTRRIPRAQPQRSTRFGISSPDVISKPF